MNNIPQLAMLGGIAAAVGMFWNKLRNLGTTISRLIIVEIHMDGYTFCAVLSHLNRKYKRMPLGIRDYFGFEDYNSSSNRREVIAGERYLNNRMVFFSGKKPLFLSDGKLRVFRGSIKPDELIKTAISEYNELKRCQQLKTTIKNRFRVIKKYGLGSVHSRININTGNENSDSPVITANDVNSNVESAVLGITSLLGVAPEQIGNLSTEQPILKTLLYPKEVDALIDRVDMWLSSEDWYVTRSVPWRFGVMLEGPAGTGKTTLLMGIAQKFDLPVYSFDMASMNNEEFEKAYSHASGNTPCIILLEDFDRVFHGDVNIVGDMGGGLTLDCILNCIAGAKPTNGVMVAITTNDPDKISEAIAKMDGDKITRPGRIDTILHIGPLDEECRRHTANRVLDFMTDAERDKIVEIGDGETAAQFIDRCVTTALNAIRKDPTIVERTGVKELPAPKPDPYNPSTWKPVGEKMVDYSPH